jgi:hypothetical protein
MATFPEGSALNAAEAVEAKSAAAVAARMIDPDMIMGL